MENNTNTQEILNENLIEESNKEQLKIRRKKAATLKLARFAKLKKELALNRRTR
jgi:hypothetical protein